MYGKRSKLPCVTPKPGHYRLGLLSPGDLVDDLAVAEEVDCRNAADAEASTEIWTLLGIDRNHCRLAGQHHRDFSHRRCE